MSVDQFMLTKGYRDEIIDHLHEIRSDHLKFEESVCSYIVSNQSNFLNVSDFICRRLDNFTHLLIFCTLINLASMVFVVFVD